MISLFARESQSAPECHPCHIELQHDKADPKLHKQRPTNYTPLKLPNISPGEIPGPFVSTTLNGNHSSFTCLRKDSLHISLKITALIQSRRFLVQAPTSPYP